MKRYTVNLIIILSDVLYLTTFFFLTREARSSLDSFDVAVIKPYSYTSLNSFIFAIAILFIILYYEKIYTYRYDFWEDTKKIFKAAVLGLLVVLSLLTLAKINAHYSRVFIIMYFLIVVIFLPILKRITKKIIFSFEFFRRKIFIIGNEEQKEVLVNEFKNNWYIGLEYCSNNYDMVLIATKDMPLEVLNKQLSQYLVSHKEVYVIPYVTKLNFANSDLIEYSNIRYSAIYVENKLLVEKNIYIKKISEKLLTLLIFPFILFLHFFIAIWIKLDSKGSIFYKQRRLGKGESSFNCYKYRTMYDNSKEILEDYINKHPEEIDYFKKYHKYKNDPRITKVGTFLRKYSLDELPQVINVLRGDMNLIGPRPYMVQERGEIGKAKDLILKVKPGITGLWQVSGRNNLTFQERIELESWYIRNWTLWQDLVIFIKTFVVVIFKIGAK